MKYKLLRDVLDLLEEYESEKGITGDISDFKQWIINNTENIQVPEPNWEGKENGRSAESVINTLIVHMNRYAKSYSKSAIWDTEFASQEDFIYLIKLRAFGPMSKMDLIKKNVHDKPAGIQIINRLIVQGWVTQQDSTTDKRSKVLHITDKGIWILDKHMDKIRKATKIVTGDLSHEEKMVLIRLLNKLDAFHKNIYDQNIDSSILLNKVDIS